MFSNDIGIDLGTATTLIYVAGKGIVLKEPSIVAMDARANKVMAVGQSAYEMLGKTSDLIRVVRPLEEGVISGGMIPKMECCVDAIHGGVERVHILDGRIPHSILIELLSDEGIGTMMKKEEAL